MTHEILTQLREKYGDKLVLTIPEVAEILRISPKNIYQIIKDGRFPMAVIRVGKTMRISFAEVVNQLTHQEEIQPTEPPKVEVQQPKIRRRRTKEVDDLSHLFK